MSCHKCNKTMEIGDKVKIICTDCFNKISDLEAKLAEKEEFLKKQKELFETVDRELYLTKDTLKHHTTIYNALVESKDQDKISFAVEQLEKVRKFADDMWGIYKAEEEIVEYIDNQIKQLRGWSRV